MKKFLSAIAILASLVPAMASADVVTNDDIERLRATALALDNGCKLLDFALTVQGGGMNAKPEWKTVTIGDGEGVTMRAPWSPYWYLVGKQIPWTESFERGVDGVGRFAKSDGCGLEREYTVAVNSDMTLAKQEAYLKGIKAPGFEEVFSLNGKKAVLRWEDAGFCDQEVLSIEVVKGKRRHVVDIRSRCSEVNSEMFRMAASLK